MSSDQWITLAGPSMTVVAVIVSAFAIRAAVHGVRDQMRTSVFLAYTDRYSRAMNRLPFDARRPGSDYSLRSASREERTAVLEALRDYFNLCSEEMWLRCSDRIDDRTWKIWVSGMKDVTRFPCFAEAWQVLAPEYDYFTEFKQFMDALATETGRDMTPIHDPAAVNQRAVRRP